MPIVIGAWYYNPGSPFYMLSTDPTMYTEAEVTAWYAGRMAPSGWYNLTETGSSYSLESSTYGIPVTEAFELDFTADQGGTGNPFNFRETGDYLRPLYCPLGYSVSYTSSPAMGPTCTPWASSPWPLKQGGGSCGSACGGTNSGGADSSSGRTVAGNPADVANGNKLQIETDYVGAGTNPLTFTRTYNSIVPASLCYSNPTTQNGSIAMGEGWSATYFQELLPTSVTDSTGTHNAVYAYRPDGRVLTFVQYQGGYSPDGDVADSLIQTASGWQYQTANDTIETYDSSGRLLSFAQRGRSPVTLSYASGSAYPDPPVAVSDAFGHTLQFAYIVSGGTRFLASITDPNGKQVSYSYDGYANLTNVTNADGSTRAYGYSTSASCHLLSSLTDEANVQYATWTYNGNWQIASSQHAGGVDAYTFTNNTYGSGGTIVIQDPLGNSRTYNESLIWGVYRTTSSTAYCPGCAEDKTRVFDASGNITSRTDFNSNQTIYTYNPQSNLETSRTEAYGTANARTIATTWDANWRQPDLITEPNRTTAFTYDSMGNVLTKTVTDSTVTPNVSRTWAYTYDSYGRMLTAKGPRTDVNSTTTYSYYTCTTGYQCGQLQTVTDPVGNVTTYSTYDAHGQPLTITDPNGVVTTLSYDTRLRLTSRQVGTETTTFSYYPTGQLKQVTLPDNSYVLYTYDNAHRLTQVSDGLGNKVVYTLDAMGNRTAENRYDPSNVLHYTHSRVINTLNQLYQDVNAAGTAAVTTTFGYDNNGNQTTINAPLSRNTTNAYDALNRLTQITDPGSGNTYFGYDVEDDLTSVKDPRSLTTSYTYNGFGDLTQQISPDTGTTNNSYDSGGNLATSTDARAAVSTYSYDAANRVTSLAYSKSGVTDQTISFTYDAGTYGKGHLTGASDANHSTAWTYDALGRVTNKSQTVNGKTKSVGYAYTNGDLTTLTTPSAQSVVYGYNSNHQVTSISVNGTSLLSAVTYEPFGAVNGWTWGNGTTVSRTYDTDEKISQISSAGVKNYTYDNAFRITGITDSTVGSSNWTYGYDLLDRLTSASKGTYSPAWTYDANGNRLTQSGTGVGAETYNISTTSNRINTITGTLPRTYAYDSAGHALSFDTFTQTFNDRGRMATQSNSANGFSASYVYDSLGELIGAINSNPNSIDLVWHDEAGHLIGEYGQAGGLIEETVWLGDIPVATLRPSGSSVAVYYVHTDHLNTPHLVTRTTDNLQMWTWFTDPWGYLAVNTNPQGGGTFNYKLRFPGQANLTGVTNLLPNGFRDYDPAVGSFVESDPIGLAGGSYSTYVYVEDDPLLLSDPLGLSRYFGFPSDKEGLMKAAVEEAKQKVRDCKGNTRCFNDNGREKIIRILDHTDYIFRKNATAYCGSSNRVGHQLANVTLISGVAFSWDACCDLASTLAHEANHLVGLFGGSESSSLELERVCFNCPRPKR